MLEGIPDPAQSLLLAHMCVDGCLNAPTEALTQHNPGPRCLSADAVRPDIAGCGARPAWFHFRGFSSDSVSCTEVLF